MTLGERLKAWRTKQDLTQTAAASLAGVQQATWSDWESDKKLPMMESLPGLKRALGDELELDHLVEAATKPAPASKPDTAA